MDILFELLRLRGNNYLVGIVLNWLIFAVSIEAPGILKRLEDARLELIDLLLICGHLFNMNQVLFLIKYAKPSIEHLISMYSNVSPCCSFLFLSMLPQLHDFDSIAILNPSIVLPAILDSAVHPLSVGMTIELFTSALKILGKTEHPESNLFFEKVMERMFKLSNFTLDLISLLFQVAVKLNNGTNLLQKATQQVVDDGFLNQLVAIAASFSASNQTDDFTTIFIKVLSGDSKKPYYFLACSSFASYLLQNRSKLSRNTLVLVESIQALSNQKMKSLFLILFAKIKPALKSQIKQILYPKQATNTASFICTDFEELSNTVKILLAQTLLSLSDEEETEAFHDPIFIPRDLSEDEIPINPFFFCDPVEIAQLSCAHNYEVKMSISREFKVVSPDFHCLSVEIASLVVPKHIGMSIDIRLSSKSLIPNMAVQVFVPTTFTPTKAENWEIADLQPSRKVNRSFGFTVNSVLNPWMLIKAVQENAVLIELKICLPVIDLFSACSPTVVEQDAIWHQLKHTKSGFSLEDSVWVFQDNVIAVRNGIARANKLELLRLLSSAKVTNAVVE